MGRSCRVPVLRNRCDAATTLFGQYRPKVATGSRRRGSQAGTGCEGRRYRLRHRFSTFIMAGAFPNSTFVGYDFHEPSIEHATAHARQSSGAGNVRFEVAKAKDFPAKDLDLVTCFDVLHDLGDPVGAASHIHRSLKPNGTWMLMEPLAGDATEENLGPVGRVAYAFSTMACVPVSLSQEVGMALGAQAGQAKLTEVIKAGGFTQVRRVAETPLNMVIEARH